MPLVVTDVALGLLQVDGTKSVMVSDAVGGFGSVCEKAAPRSLGFWWVGVV